MSVRLLCIFGHKWQHSIEDISFIRSYSCDMISYPTEVRFCLRCNKKQRKRVTDWVNTYLTIEELREIKLKKLIK